MKLEDRADVRQFVRDKIEALLAQCSEGQREMFTRLFGTSVRPDKLNTALDLCERTVTKNERTGRLNNVEDDNDR